MSLDFEQQRKEIIKRFEKNIQAHWDKDVDFILDDLSDDFFVMSEGNITYPSKEEQRIRFSKYLQSTTFSEYTSLMEPEVEFSDDCSTAWGRYKVKVKGETVNEDGSKTQLDFLCAWLWLFRRVDNRWIRFGEVSTWK